MGNIRNPKLSIIIPIYNSEKWLERTIKSILNQSYRNYELLLINDGSTDRSSYICAEYGLKDERIKIYHKLNGGVSSARNLALDNSNGEWIIFCDADDYWIDETILEKFISIIENNDIDIIRGEYIPVDSNNKEIRISKNDKESFSNRILSPYEFIKYIINGEYFTPLVMIRKSFIGNVRFNEEQIFLEDMNFFIQLFTKEFKGYYTPIVFYAYVKQNNSISHKQDKRKLRDSFLMCDRYYEQSSFLRNDELKEFYIYNSIMMYYWTLQTLADDLYYNNRLQIIQELKLIETHKKTLSRINKNYKRYSLYLPFILPNPILGVKLLHYKDKFIEYLKLLKKSKN